MDAPVVAGTVATVVFTVGALPMLAKAWRTRDVASYSPGHLVLSNVGNAFYTVYVLHLPPGPLWALHAFHTVSTAVMLAWYVRHARPRPAPVAADPVRRRGRGSRAGGRPRGRSAAASPAGP